MKTGLLIIIGIVIVSVIIALTIGTIGYQSAYNQNCNSDGGYVVGFLKCTYINEDFGTLEIPDPICFVTDKITSGETGSAVTMDACYPLSDFETLECTKPMLEYIYKYTNLLDEEFNGNYYRDAIGLPDDATEEEYEKCTDFIYEKRSSFIISKLHNLNPTERDEFITKYTNIIYSGEFHSQVYITDLQNEYSIGEPITFTVATWGYGHPCQSPSFVYYYETKDPANIVFEDKFIRLCQVLEESNYTNYYQELDSNRTDKALNDNVFPVFDKPGSYIVSVDDKAEYEFQIIEMK